MKTKKQLRIELIAAERENVRLRYDNEFLNAEKQTFKMALLQAKKDLVSAQTAAREAKEAEADASARAAQLMYINDVLCAELQDCDRCIDTVRMALEQKNARTELLNRITGPLV